MADLRAVAGITAKDTAHGHDANPSFSLQELSTATSLAVVGGEGHELDQLGYDMLEELGLALSPEDAAVLMGAEQ